MQIAVYNTVYRLYTTLYTDTDIVYRLSETIKSVITISHSNSANTIRKLKDSSGTFTSDPTVITIFQINSLYLFLKTSQNT